MPCYRQGHKLDMRRHCAKMALSPQNLFVLSKHNSLDIPRLVNGGGLVMVNMANGANEKCEVCG
jgi:hypothetical protein